MRNEISLARARVLKRSSIRAGCLYRVNRTVPSLPFQGPVRKPTRKCQNLGLGRMLANKDGVAAGRWDLPANELLCPENYALEKWLERAIAEGRKPHMDVFRREQVASWVEKQRWG